MFTGIIKKTAKVKSAERRNAGLLIEVFNGFGKVNPGESISVNGVCSTVKKAGKALLFEYMPETIRLTNVEFLKKGDKVNLERSLKVGDRLDGHMLLGHVDCRGDVIAIQKEGNSRIFRIRPHDQSGVRYAVFKGSIAVEGISLTIAKVLKSSFLVKIIPYTMGKTNLKHKKEKDIVNIEFDILAKYRHRIPELDLERRKHGVWRSFAARRNLSRSHSLRRKFLKREASQTQC